jgi:hypothetical protein
MNKIVLFVIISFLGLNEVSAQKNELELQLGMGQFTENSDLFNSTKKFQSGLLYNNQLIRIAVKFNTTNVKFFSSGVETSKYGFYTENSLNENINLQESFLKIPLKFNIRKSISDQSSFQIGLGVYSSVLLKQMQIKPDNSTVIYGLGDYSKAGICASGNYIFVPSAKNGFSIGFSVDNDLFTLSKQNNSVVSNHYWMWSLDMGYFFMF